MASQTIGSIVITVPKNIHDHAVPTHTKSGDNEVN
jgi:hypothetical protein